MALDKFGRNIHYMRISLTDKCNLRCVYCMPEDITFRPSPELLQDDEIMKLFRVFVDLGFDKFRLTGGEPTVRANIVDLVREMASTPGVNQLTMTTNGLMLGDLAHDLAEAGLQRCNISIDTLDAERFKKVTRWGDIERVWEGIQAAEDAGLLPIKLNSVVVRNFNDQEDVVAMSALTHENDWQIRFIEMMPFAGVTDFQQSGTVSEAELISTIEAQLGKLHLQDDGKLDGEARLYKFKGARGTVGFISSVTAPFCAACTRARLTADGTMRLCLLREKEVDLMTPLRAGASEEELKQLIRAGIWEKPWGHKLDEDVIPLNRTMSEIGG